MSNIEEAITRELLERDEYKCLNCNAEEFLEQAHYIARSAAGMGELDNLMLLCRECHRKQHDGKLLVQKIKGKFFFKEIR